MVEKNLRTRLVALERNTFLEEKDTGWAFRTRNCGGNWGDRGIANQDKRISSGCELNSTSVSESQEKIRKKIGGPIIIVELQASCSLLRVLIQAMKVRAGDLHFLKNPSHAQRDIWSSHVNLRLCVSKHFAAVSPNARTAVEPSNATN
jgi:hypothetical protein